MLPTIEEIAKMKGLVHCVTCVSYYGKLHNKKLTQRIKNLAMGNLKRHVYFKHDGYRRFLGFKTH